VTLNKQILTWLTVIIVILTNIQPLFAQGKKQDNELPQPHSIHKLRSEDIGQTYTLFIYLPDNYNTTQKKYPALFVLDGDASLDELTVQEKMVVDEKSIVIGIGYGQKASERRPSRLRDLTPHPVQGLEGTGGGQKFQYFLKNKIITFIDSTYRVKDENRTFIGHSLGGFFVLYSIFSEPGLFDNYISISPSVAISNLRTERMNFKNESNKSLRLYLAAGGNENVDRMLVPFKSLIDMMSQQTYDGIRFMDSVIEGEDHFSVVKPALNEGLYWVFNDGKD